MCFIGLVPAVTYNNNSVTKAQPDLNVAPQESNQDKMFEPSSNQERHKLLMDSIRSWNGTQIRISEGFPQNIQVFASYWSEEELDNLWVGVRRHGKENWHTMLRDPKLRFSPWRTERALAEKWMMEQPKLLGNTLAPTPYYQYVNPAGIALPPLVTPGLGAMTRFLTDATQFSLSNAYLNNPGMFPPRPPHASTNAQGNGSRLFNRRVRAHKRSGNTWGRFRARNRVPTLTPLASRSRNDITPSGVGGTLEIRHFQPPLPAPPLSLQHSSNSRNGINSSNTGSGIPGLEFPSSQPIGANTTDPKRPKNVINLESDASSEGTISDK